MSLLLRKYRYFSSAIMYTGAARIEVPELWMVKVFLNRHEVEHLIRRQWHRSGSESMGIFCHDLREAVIKLAQPASPLPGIRRTIMVCGLALAMAAPALSAQQALATAAQSPRKTRHATKLKPAVPESIPEVTMPAPPPPVRRAPEQMPPGVPQVSWDGSQLTITADNSTLADILVAIRARTGAEIDIPTNASRERMAARLGPGPARDIIATLLSWTDYDYIIQASDTDPLGVRSVLLTPRGKSDATVASTGTAGYRAGARSANHRFGQGNTSPADTSAQESSEAETTWETPVAATHPAPQEPQPAAANGPPAPDVPAAQADAQPASLDIQPTQANLSAVSASPVSELSPSFGSSTEQKIQTMQNLYQQRKQMMEDARKTLPAN